MKNSPRALSVGGIICLAYFFVSPHRPNPAVDPVPFGHWTLRDKAAQRRSLLRWGFQTVLRLHTFIAAALIFISSSAFACGEEEAIAFAKHFFAEHRTFYFKDSPAVRDSVTPALYRALQNHYRCAAQDGLCHIDYEPWLGAQDGEVSGPISFSFASPGNNKASVSLRYQFELSPDRPKKRQTVVLHLTSASEPQCWKVSDLITPLGQSLAKLYRAKPQPINPQDAAR